MKRFLLTSCATALVLSVAGGNSAMAQTNGNYNVPAGTTQTQPATSPITDQGSTPTTVTVTGGGVLELDGLNSYTGGTAVTGNTLVRVSQDQNLGAASGGLTLGDSASQGILQIGNTTGGNTGATSFSSNRAITLGTGGGTLNNFMSGNATFNGVVGGAGTLTIGNGTVQLTNNANSYAGQTTVQNGAQLIISNDAQLGAATVTSNGTTSANSVNLGSNTNGGSLTIAAGTTGFTSARTIIVNGGIINGPANGGVATFTGIVQGGALEIGGGTVALTNTANTYSGGTVIQNNATLQISNDTQLGYAYSQVMLGDGHSGGTLQYTNAAALGSSHALSLSNGGVNTILTNGAGTVTLAGQIVGLGGLNVGGSGTLILSGANTFTGDLRVLNGATVQIGNDNQLGGYTTSVNSVTGQTTAVANPLPAVAPAGTTAFMNNLHLDGGTLQFSGATTILHPIFTSSQNSTIDTGSNNVVITSNIADESSTVSGGLVKIGTGTLTLDGQNSYTGGTVINNGALDIGDANTLNAKLAGDVTVNTGAILAGSGTVTGTVINNGGVVAPANTLTVNGYIQGSGSVLAPEITPSTTGTAASELKVTGTAAIGGGTLSVGYGTGFLHPSTYQIFNAGAIAGTGFSTVNAGIVPSAGLTATILQQGNAYYVVLTQKADLPDHPTVLPSLTNAAMQQAQQTTGALLDRLATARTNALADELAVAMTDTHRVRGTSPYGVWVQPVGDFGTEDGAGALPGYTTRGEGFLMGADTEWIPGISIGVAFGYTHSSLREDGGASGTNSTPLLAVYGGWWKGPFAIDALAGIAMGQIDGSRPIDLPLAGTTTPTLQIAKSNHTANEKIAGLQASGAWAFDGWVVGPQLGAKFVNLHQTSFTETGTDIYNYTVADQSLNSLRPFAALDVTKRFFIGDHWALVPNFKVGYEHEVNNDVRKMSAQTQGDDYLWVFNGLLPGANILHLIGGVKWELDRTEAFYVTYDRQQSNTGETQYVTGGFRYRL